MRGMRRENFLLDSSELITISGPTLEGESKDVDRMDELCIQGHSQIKITPVSTDISSQVIIVIVDVTLHP